MFEVERRQQERCDCHLCQAAAALTVGYSFSRLHVPPAAPEPRVTAATSAEPNLSHPVTLPRAGSPACSHCWEGGMRDSGELGEGSVIKHWKTGQVSEQAGAVLGVAQGRVLAALAGVFLTRVAIHCSGPFHLSCLYSLLKVLFLFKSRFLTL